MKIGIVGAGAWGTACALAALRGGNDVTMWARNPILAKEISEKHENTQYMAGLKLDPVPEMTSNLSDLAKMSALLMVTPAQALRQNLKDLKPYIAPETPLILCSKGIETGTGMLLSEVVEDVLPTQKIGILSGPSFAKETIQNRPTAVTLAMENKKDGLLMMKTLGSAYFRPYLCTDIIGAQIGGAVKNVMAIACGIAHGRALGENARAALITRGLAEITRLGIAMGGKLQTLMGLSGLGDLALTCNSLESRNMSFGYKLGKGQTVKEILSQRKAVTEGFYTTTAVLSRAKSLGVDMPICRVVDQILNENYDIDEAMENLLNRPFSLE